MSACRSCGAEIEWVRSMAGKPMPLDAAPVAGGNIILQLDLVDGEAVADVVGKGNGNRVSHFATCPNAAEHRKS